MWDENVIADDTTRHDTKCVRGVTACRIAHQIYDFISCSSLNFKSERFRLQFIRSSESSKLGHKWIRSAFVCVVCTQDFLVDHQTLPTDYRIHATWSNGHRSTKETCVWTGQRARVSAYLNQFIYENLRFVFVHCCCCCCAVCLHSKMPNFFCETVDSPIFETLFSSLVIPFNDMRRGHWTCVCSYAHHGVFHCVSLSELLHRNRSNKKKKKNVFACLCAHVSCPIIVIVQRTHALPNCEMIVISIVWSHLSVARAHKHIRYMSLTLVLYGAPHTHTQHAVTHYVSDGLSFEFAMNSMETNEIFVFNASLTHRHITA